MHVLPRGNWMDDSGPIVVPDVPASLPLHGCQGPSCDAARPGGGSSPGPKPAGRPRDGQPPLEADVRAGTGDDAGRLRLAGTWPTHPELLDWLACAIRVNGGWDVRAMLKRMAMTAAYRQSPVPVRPTSSAIRKPIGRAQNAFRLDAEFVRDNALAISGLLSDRIGGPSVKPYQPPGYWVFLNFPTREYHPDHGPDAYRRGLYTYWQRTFLHPSLLAFDASTREECVVQRPRSNTPLQALVLLNDPTYVEAARVLATRLIRGSRDESLGPSRPCLPPGPARPPRPEEAAILTGPGQTTAAIRGEPGAARELLGIGDPRLPRRRPGRTGRLDLRYASC